MTRTTDMRDDGETGILPEVPSGIRRAVTATWPGETVELAAPADLDHADKAFAAEWLVVTARRLAVYAGGDGDDAPELRRELPLDGLRRLTIDGRVGCNCLVAERAEGAGRTEDAGTAAEADAAAPGEDAAPAGERIELCSFTNGRKRLFSGVADWVERRLADEEPPDLAARLRGSICPRCGKAIPEGLNKCPRCTDRRAVLLRLIAHLRPYPGRLVLMLAAMFAATGFGLITPYMSKLFIDVILAPDPATGAFPNAGWLVPACGLLLAAYVMQFACQSVQERMSGYLGFSTVADIRARMYDRLQALSLSFYDRQQTGALIHRVNQDTSELQRLMVDFLPITVESLCFFVGIGCLLFWLSWQVTVFVLVPIVAVVVFAKLVFPWFFRLVHRFFHRRSRMSSLVGDALGGVRVIKAFGQERAEVDKFGGVNQEVRMAGIHLVRRFSLIHPVFHILIMSGLVVVWLIGGHQVVAGEMRVGAVVAYTGYLMMFYRPVFILTRMVDMLTNALGAADRVFDIIDTDPAIADDPDAVGMPPLARGLAFDHVTFGYDRYEPVIKDMTADIAAGEMVGLVGRSGAGKSTFINLVCRLYDVDEGAIRVDGVDLRRIRQEELRARIGIVLQETYLFDGSLYENIAYGRPRASREDVVAAARTAHAHDFIMDKPDGYDTEIGERGLKLSGGEKQRIAIARAVLKDPAILILDEATSSVDTQTEQRIQAALSELVKGRTTIAIAHRLSTLRNCDRLFVLDDGRIVERGTHQELLDRGGVFADLVAKQRELSAIVAVEG